MKQIKVNDDVYTKLKALADINYRTMGGQIDFMMSEKPPVQPGNVHTEQELVKRPAVVHYTPEEAEILNKPVYKRTLWDIDNDIRSAERQKLEELSMCQSDEDAADKDIAWNDTIQELWAEYNELKAKK